MKYLKLDKDITKERCLEIENKIKDLGYKGENGCFKIDHQSLKHKYLYLYRGLGNNIMGQYCQSPHRWRGKLKDSEAYGEEITIEEFLKI